jgi:ankyrin repeat protein
MDNLDELKKNINSNNINNVINDIDKNTALHFAVQMKRIPIIKFLLNLNANQNIKNANNQTPIEISDSAPIRKVLYDCEMSKLQLELDVAYSKIDDLKQQLTTEKTKTEFISSNLSKLQTQNDTKQQQISDQQNIINKLHQDLTMTKNNLSKATEDLANTIIDRDRHKRKGEQAELAFLNLKKSKH